MRRLVLAAAVLLGAMACAAEPGDESGGDGGSCPVGSVGCPCTGGGACDPGLDCRSEVCVDPDSVGTGGGGGCTYFPDTCPAPQQCYQDVANAGATLCSDPGAKALGDDCDNTAGTRDQYCGRELACVQYGAAPSFVFRCSQLCKIDADCAATMVACVPLSGPDELKICPLQ